MKNRIIFGVAIIVAAVLVLFLVKNKPETVVVEPSVDSTVVVIDTINKLDTSFIDTIKISE
jgi:hypothetical protein